MPNEMLPARIRDTACWCCSQLDEPNGPGPAINTGFCQECTDAGCRERNVGTPCARGVAAIDAEEEAALQRAIARIKAGTYHVAAGYDDEPYVDPSASTDGSGQ